MNKARVWYRIPGREVAYMQGQLSEAAVLPEKNCFLIAPFDRSGTCWLLEPETDSAIPDQAWYNTWNYRASTHEASDPYPGDAYVHWVEQVQAQLISAGYEPAARAETGSALKVVTSRSVFRRLPPEPVRWFERACRLYPDAMVYLLDAAETGCWIGATPEQLLSWEHGRGKTVALAGTKKASPEVTFGEKEQEEQGYIRTFIKEHLQNLNIPFQEAAIRELQQGNIRHLCTEFHFDITTNQLCDLATQLHPTPALCGYPRTAALRILEAERTQRRFYGGFLGPWSPEQGSLWVNIRCGEVFADGINLYAGTGITKASDARAEFQETEHKLRVLGAVL
ncbi:MAG: hypothetical protein RL160_1972 [Bacteroidota bacterium]|jgi:isochorismate synthase